MPRITVGIRIKPETESETIKSFSHNVKSEGGGNVEISANNSKHDFAFDFVFGQHANQEEIFDKCARPVVDAVLEGYNGTLFAYGQTGAGKTHTVTGPQIETYDERGICLRTIDYIFSCVRRFKERQYVVKISVIEIYNDNVFDLLRKQNSTDTSQSKLIIMDTPDGVTVPALYQFPAESEDEAYTKISEANLNRAVAEHQMNRRSSRSHAIYTFYVTQSSAVSNVSDGSDVVQSKLHLVDLAGSERIEKTGSTGGLVKEATHINKSLSFLEQVVQSLAKQVGGAGSATVVASYRQSKLTYILKDSLGGNCNTLLIACIWPHKNHVWETLSTLRFATRMKCIENYPKRNSLVTGNGTSSSTRSLQVTIEALKKELIMRDAIHSYRRHDHRGGTEAGEKCANTQYLDTAIDVNSKVVYTDKLTTQQQSATVRMVSDFARQSSDEVIHNSATCALDVKSQAQWQMVAEMLKSALWHACGGCEDKVAESLEKVSETLTAKNRMRSVSPTKMSTILEANGKPSSGIDVNQCDVENVSIAMSSPIPDIPMTEKLSSMTERSSDFVRQRDTNRTDSIQRKLDNLDNVVEQTSHDLVAMESNSTEIEAGNENMASNDTSVASHSQKDPFELFKSNEGSQHHAAYEEAKLYLKEQKSLQKELISAVNAAKANIDSVSEQLNELNSEQIATLKESCADEIMSLKRDLSDTKNVYRSKRAELLRVKEDIAAGTLRKQQLLKDLVQAYEKYSTEK